MVEGKISEIGNLPQEDTWAFEALKELLMRQKGFDLEAYKERCILRRIYLKVRSKGYPSLGRYFRVLNRDRDELEELFEYLTIHVTEFFRNPSAFHYLSDHVLPRLLARLGRGDHLRIWSVGCSSGEEPFSLAITVMKVAGKLGLPRDFQVLATDVDRTVVARGKAALYKEEALKNLDGRDKEGYFLPTDKGYQVVDEVREKVTFRVGNVLSERPRENQDLIVCRNLLIYFSRDNQEKVITGFSRTMNPDGYLMLGKAETLIGRNRLYFQNVSPVERIYRLRDVPLEEEHRRPPI